MGAGPAARTASLKRSRETPTMSDTIRRYEFINTVEGKSPRTICWYSDNLRDLAKYMRLQMPCDSLSGFTLDTVRNYILYLQRRPRFQGHPHAPSDGRRLSPKTIQCHVRTAKAFSSWLFREGYTMDNRLQGLKLPKAPTKIKEPLSTEEINTVLGCIDTRSPIGFRDHAMISTALDTGMRASELAGVSLGNTNLDAGYIKVMGKGSKERIIPIGEVVRSLLWKYLIGAREKLLKNGCDSLFLSEDGKPMSLNAVKLMFARVARKSGVRRLHPHLCRLTFAINYLLNGGDIFSLQAILGHSSLEMVRQYLHFTISQIRTQHHKFSPMDRINGQHAPGDGLGCRDSATNASRWKQPNAAAHQLRDRLGQDPSTCSRN